MSEHRASAAPTPIGGLDADTDGQRLGPMRFLPDLLRQFGVDPAAVLAELGLPADALDSADRRLPFGHFGGLLAIAAERTGCEHFGLLVGRRAGLGEFGPIGELARYSPTVGDALRNYVVHQHLYSRGGLTFLVTEDDTATLGFSIYHPNTIGATHHHDGVLAIILNVMRELTAPDWLPEEFSLAHSAPADRAPLRQAFPRRLRFDAEYTGARFPASVLTRPVTTADSGRLAIAEAQVAAIGRRSLVNDVRRALRLALTMGDASGDRVAQTLAMHRRTLNRRLRDLGTTFQAVLDEVRLDAARHHLLLTRMALIEVAAALGYGDASSFTRAFKRWTGATPGEFRRREARVRLVAKPAA